MSELSELSDLLLRGVNLSNVDSRNLADALRRLERGLGSVLPPQGASGIGMTHGHTMDQITGGSSGSGAFGASIQDVASASNAGSGTAVPHDNHVHKLAIVSPLAWSGGTLQITQAGAAANGYLSSVDWNTFNNKQAAISFPLASGSGGTGVANAGKLTLATDATITGGGTLALGGRTLTVPASGSAAISTGISGGQTISGGTGAGENLVLQSTSHPTKGIIYIGTTVNKDASGDLNITGGASIKISSGDLHIGTEPTGFEAYPFTIYDSLGGMALKRTSTNEPFVLLSNDTANSGGQLRGLNAGGVRITNYDVSTEWLRIDANGNHGIGVTPSSCRLAVKGLSTYDLQQWINAAGSQVGEVDKDGNAEHVNINATGVYKVDGIQVVTNRVVDARCDDTINTSAWDSTTAGVLDALRDAMITHGLIAAA